MSELIQKRLQPYQARSYREMQKVWITRCRGITEVF